MRALDATNLREAARLVSALDATNFREAARLAIRQYESDGRLVDGLLWDRIVALYESELQELTELRALRDTYLAWRDDQGGTPGRAPASHEKDPPK